MGEEITVVVVVVVCGTNKIFYKHFNERAKCNGC